MNIENIKILNLLNSIVTNICTKLMKYLIDLQFKIKLKEKNEDFIDLKLMNLLV